MAKMSEATKKKIEGKGDNTPLPVRKIEIGKKPKIAIVGFAPGKENAPYEDQEFEIWGCNEMHMAPEVKRLDVLFELHDLDWIKEGKRWKGHYPWLCENEKIPVVMQKQFEAIPMSVPYPKDEIVDEFGRYFTNTISLQIALAIRLNVKEIHIYGVNMATDQEYGAQRPSVEFFLGWAKGKGIKVHIPMESDICKNFYIYGLEDGQMSVMSSRLDALSADNTGKITFFQNRITNDSAALHQAIGANNTIAYISKSFIFPNNNLPKGEV